MFANARSGIIPWSSAATQAVITPTAPNEAPGEGQVIVSRIMDNMDPEEGKFTRERERSYQLIKDMETANRIPGTTQDMRQARQAFEDENIFPLG
jgi:hypothetical protein